MKRNWMVVFWSAFLPACLTELIVFALVDPNDLAWRGQALALSRMAVYTLGFFAFWLVAVGASALTLLLLRMADDVNRRK